MDNDENQLKLPEQLLASLAIPEEGWTGDFTPLPDTALLEIRNVLKQRFELQQVNEIQTYLIQGFGEAFDIAQAECVMRQAIDQQSVGSKKPSAKLGVQLRVELTQLIAQLEDETKSDAAEICARILKYPLLARLVTIFLEQEMAGRVIDPLRNSTSRAILHLLPILVLLLNGVNKGVFTGKPRPAINSLAKSVVVAMFHASKKIHGRTWDPYANEEKGIGLAVCRILAEALQNALPEHCRQSSSAEMSKPYRNAIKLVRETV